MSPPINVKIEFVVVPPSHFMFSNNQTRLTTQFTDVNHKNVVTKKLKFKKRVGAEGNPNLILNVNVVSDAAVNGGSDSINPWDYLP